MRERPILFSAPMVLAILEGRKSQTRRVCKVQPVVRPDLSPSGLLAWLVNVGTYMFGDKPMPEFVSRCPYGQPGDRLWVRETGWERPIRTPRQMREGADTWPKFAYDADGWSDDDHADFKRWGFRRRPSIHMPRWASRILLEVTAVRVERLRDISEADATAEGVYADAACNGMFTADGNTYTTKQDGAVGAYAELWESLHGYDAWDANPWVWVVEFKRVTL